MLPTQPETDSARHPILRYFFALGDVVFHELHNLLFLNVLFLFTCLPIVTIGPALSALGRVTGDMARRQGSERVKSYFRYFRMRLKATIPCGLLNLLALALFAFSFWFYNEASSQNKIFFFLSVLMLMGAMLSLIMTFQWLPALTLQTEEKVLVLLKQACVRFFIRLPSTLLALAVTIALTLAELYFFPGSLPIIFLLAFSVPSLFGSFSRVELPELERKTED